MVLTAIVTRVTRLAASSRRPEHGASDAALDQRDPPFRSMLAIRPDRSITVVARRADVASMSSLGDACDDGMCENFFATLECELLDRRGFGTQAEARVALFDFIEGFYNRQHSLDRLSLPDRLRASARDQSRRTSACCRACGRQGQALRAAPCGGRPFTSGASPLRDRSRKRPDKLHSVRQCLKRVRSTFPPRPGVRLA